MKTLPLYNRYNTDTYLENIEGNKWLLKTKDKEGFNYMRVGFTDNSHNIIEFIDPPGGPFMSIGKNIDNKKITNIEHEHSGFVITLEDEDNKD